MTNRIQQVRRLYMGVQATRMMVNMVLDKAEEMLVGIEQTLTMLHAAQTVSENVDKCRVCQGELVVNRSCPAGQIMDVKCCDTCASETRVVPNDLS